MSFFSSPLSSSSGDFSVVEKRSLGSVEGIASSCSADSVVLPAIHSRSPPSSGHPAEGSCSVVELDKTAPSGDGHFLSTATGTVVPACVDPTGGSLLLPVSSTRSECAYEAEAARLARWCDSIPVLLSKGESVSRAELRQLLAALHKFATLPEHSSGLFPILGPKFSTALESCAHGPVPKDAPRFADRIRRALLFDLQWWSTHLQRYDKHSKLAIDGEVFSAPIFVDASPKWGLGILIPSQDSFYAAWRIIKPLGPEEGGIATLEAWAIALLAELLVNSLGPTCAGRVFRVYADNQGINQSYQRGWNRNEVADAVIQRTKELVIANNFAFEIIHVPSAKNLADPISRGIIDPSLHALDGSSVRLPAKMESHLEFHPNRNLVWSPQSASVPQLAVA